MDHFFSRIQVDGQMYTRVKLLGGCRCRPYSNVDQLVNKRSKILAIITFHIAHLGN